MTFHVSTEVYTVEEVATIFRLPAAAIRRLIRQGELPAIRLGRTYRVPRHVVDQFIDVPAVSYGLEDLGFGMWRNHTALEDAVDYVNTHRAADKRTLRELIADLWTE